VSLAEKGNLLVGRVEFGDAANGAYLAGQYDGWSVSIPRRGKDSKRYLHHLALLGETPPKIPGLMELEPASFDYADGDKVETYSFEGAIKEREAAQVTEQEAAELKKKNEELEAEKKKLLEEKAETEKAAEAAKKPAEAPAGDKPDGKTDGEDFSDRVAKMEEELRKSRVEALMAKVGGKTPEGLRDKIRGLAGRIACDGESFNFSDNGKTASAKAMDLLGEILSQWPSPVKTGGGGFEYSDASGEGKPADWGKVAKGM
jgi:hypothetical protein